MDQKIKAEITRRLKKLDPTKVNDLIESLEGLGNVGIRPGDVFPRGTPLPDTIGVVTNALNEEQLKKLIDFSIENPAVINVKFFPLGIIINEEFRAEFSIRA